MANHGPLTRISLNTVIVLLLIFTFQPLKRFFDRFTNRIFYRDAYDTTLFLTEFNRQITRSAELATLLPACLRLVRDNIKTEFGGFGIKPTSFASWRFFGSNSSPITIDDLSQIHATKHLDSQHVFITEQMADQDDFRAVLRRQKIGALVRIGDKKLNLGYLILGDKRSGNAYSTQDEQVLEIIGNELIVAIQNALRFEEIESFNKQLQQKVKEATNDLKRINKKLVELDEAKDEFISMASHQLRTPLTSVKGYISMMLDRDLGSINSTQEKALREAFASSQRMVFLIADFLNVSRIRTGRFLIELTEVDLPRIVSEELSQIHEIAKGRGVSLNYQPPINFPKLMLDDNKTRQVMMNMIDNAIYYTPAGGQISIQLYQSNSDIIFKVIDSGIGVPRAEKHKLFTKFYRAENARKFRPDGTGLGLFMAQKIIVGQGGSTIFESLEGKGSTFGFRFPLAKHLPNKSPRSKGVKS